MRRITLLHIFLQAALAVHCLPHMKIIENGNTSMVLFRQPLCQKRTDVDLRRAMGALFDEARMATSDSIEQVLRATRSAVDKDDHRELQTESPKNDKTGSAALDMLLAFAQGGYPAEKNKYMDYKGSPFSRHRDSSERGLVRRKKRSAYPVGIKLLPWECSMETEWIKMREGVFPRYVQTGRCAQKKCMYGLFDCIPVKYVIKILRRDPRQCYPIPVLGSQTTYEEAWVFDRFEITVCCQCRRKPSSYHGNINTGN